MIKNLILDIGNVICEWNPERLSSMVATNPDEQKELDAGLVAMQRAADAGIPMYILSNMQHHAWAYLQKNHACFGLCTGVVVSCEAQLIKPDPKIYHHLCERFSLEPSECLFIDDMLENVEAALACGWQAEQMTSIAESEQIFNKVIDKITISG